jgi:hypothetical protein
MSKGMLREALIYCNDPKGAQQVASAHANQLLAEHKYEQAAEVFA